MNELSKFVSDYMERHNLSQRGFAEAINVSNSTIGRMVHRGIAGEETLKKLAVYCRHDLSDLYRMAGFLPDEEEPEVVIERQLVAILTDLSEEDQDEILEIVRAIADVKRRRLRRREE